MYVIAPKQSHLSLIGFKSKIILRGYYDYVSLIVRQMCKGILQVPISYITCFKWSKRKILLSTKVQFKLPFMYDKISVHRILPNPSIISFLWCWHSLYEIRAWISKYVTRVCTGRTVYPKKYAHGFVVLCFVVVKQSFIMNSHEVIIHIHQGCFAGTGAIVRLP